MKDELEGIIIRYQEYREHDAILHVLCRKRGIVHVKARGIQKAVSYTHLDVYKRQELCKTVY